MERDAWPTALRSVLHELAQNHRNVVGCLVCEQRLDCRLASGKLSLGIGPSQLQKDDSLQLRQRPAGPHDGESAKGRTGLGPQKGGSSHDHHTPTV